MEAGTAQKRITLAFINDKSPILDVICNDLVASGIEVAFRSETIEHGFTQLSTSNKLPDVCIIDIDFYDKNVLAQLRELKTQYPSIKLIAHSDIDTEKPVISLLDIGVAAYLLIGSDKDDFKKAIEGVADNGRYFSVGVAKIAQEYFSSN